jgi:uncharacterized protein
VDPVAIIRKYYAPYPVAMEFLLKHSEMVTRKALEVARRIARLNPDMRFIEEASMLHDIGIFLTDAPQLGCRGGKPYLLHGVIGRELLDRENLPRHALVCERHVGAGITEEDIKRKVLPLPLRDMTPRSLEERIICYADKFYSKDNDTLKEKPLEKVRKMIKKYGPDKLAAFDGWHEMFGG